MAGLVVEASARSHIGLVRRRNEDSFLAGEALFAVADGLGGHAAGDVASSTVIDPMLLPMSTSMGAAVSKSCVRTRSFGSRPEDSSEFGPPVPLPLIASSAFPSRSAVHPAVEP